MYKPPCNHWLNWCYNPIWLMIHGCSVLEDFVFDGWLFRTLDQWLHKLQELRWIHRRPRRTRSRPRKQFSLRFFFRVMRRCGSQVTKAPLFFQVRMNLESRIYDFVCLQSRDEHIEYPEEYKAGRRHSLDWVECIEDLRGVDAKIWWSTFLSGLYI